MRLAKYLAHAGVASRRRAEELIAAGRVTVAGETVRDPARDVDESSEVAVDGRPLAGPEPREVYAVHKPAGVVSTADDPQGRPTVVGLVPSPWRLYPVGRLDVDVTGLLLLTNDGELANRLMHPRHEVERTYQATVANSPVGEDALRALREGVDLDDGRTSPAAARRLAGDVVELILHEGRKRQVKRMCAAVGHPVRALRRTRFGPLELGDLPEGGHRLLTGDEVEALRRASG
jgi:23S rRNA pseudouridine2605 synthase